MWETPVPIFDDEDEDELINEFVRLSVLYPKHQPFEITAHMFNGRRDPFPRANQAALKWAEDLSIKERIRQARLRGSAEELPVDSKETKLRKLEAIYNDPEVRAADRIKAMELHAQIQGEIKKASEGEEGNSVRPIVVTYGLDPRASANG